MSTEKKQVAQLYQRYRATHVSSRWF